MTVERMAWSGSCDECFTVHAIYPSLESSEAEQEEISRTWPTKFAFCYVRGCEGTIDWNGNDPIAQVFTGRML